MTIAKKTQGLLLLFLLFGGGCARAPDEQKLRDTIAAMESALESGEAGGFMEHVADDFSGQQAGVDQRQLRALLVAQTLRHEHISVLPGPLEVKLFKDRATVKLRVLAAGGGWLPESGRQFDIESHWRIEDGGWVCFRADWR